MQKRSNFSITYNKSKFVSVATKVRYQELFVKWPMVKERGLEVLNYIRGEFEETEAWG